MYPDNYNKIDDYLSGNLQGEELKQFKKSILNDNALAEEVELYRDMEKCLQPSGEDALRENLDILGKQFDFAQNKKRGNGFLKWGVISFVVLAVAGWFLWPLSEPAISIDDNIEVVGKEKNPVIEPVDKEVKKEEKTIPNLPQKEKNKITPKEENKKQPTQKKSPIKEEKKAPRIYADFQVNPDLESFVGNKMRADDTELVISSPVQNAALKIINENVNLLFSGKINTDKNEIDIPLRLLFFSNKKEDYGNFNFIFAENLSFEKAENIFQFKLDKNIELTPGLYYYLIEDEESGEVYFANKIIVEN